MLKFVEVNHFEEQIFIFNHFGIAVCIGFILIALEDEMISEWSHFIKLQLMNGSFSIIC